MCSHTRDLGVACRTALLITISILGFALFTPWALASHGGPTTFVDANSPANEDNDCDFHFKTLAAALKPPSSQCHSPDEYSTIIVRPGAYNEQKLEVKRNGLKIQSSDGMTATKINGCFEISGKDVELSGFDINAETCDHGIAVLNNNVRLLANKVHGAKINGIEVAAAGDESIIEGNEIVNNTNFGLHAVNGSHRLRIVNNRINSNGSHGVALDTDNDFFVIQGNEVNLNQQNGIWIRASDYGSISNNRLSANKLNGVALEEAHANQVNGNSITGSDRFGVSIAGGSSNEVQNNTLKTNAGGGLALIGNAFRAIGNRVLTNEIQGHNRPTASGIVLEGDVVGNLVGKNKLINNTVGIRFAPAASGNGAGSNRIEENEIQDSVQQGVLVQGSFGINVFRANKIIESNQEGLKILGGRGNEEITGNVIERNGSAGVYIENSNGNFIHGNQISRNSGHGVALKKTVNTTISENTVLNDEQHGVLLEEASQTTIRENTIAGQQKDAIHGAGVSGVVISGNTLNLQDGRGVSLTDCTASPIDLEMNLVSRNSLGGVFLSNCKGADVQMNEIVDNLRFGLWVEKVSGSQDIQARRNWWGDPKGPAGIFSGAGNAVIMMGVQGGNSFMLEEDQILESVLPWLTDRLKEQLEDSVTGFLVRGAGSDSLEINALGSADTHVMLSGTEQRDKGIAVVAKYEGALPTSNSHYAPLPPLPSVLKTVNVFTGGFSKGTAVVAVQYTDAELQASGAAKENLRLFYFDPTNRRWVPMPGKSMENVNWVQGEIAVELLRQGIIIALAPVTS
jgi:parallel beta-helix repeat protein